MEDEQRDQHRCDHQDKHCDRKCERGDCPNRPLLRFPCSAVHLVIVAHKRSPWADWRLASRQHESDDSRRGPAALADRLKDDPGEAGSELRRFMVTARCGRDCADHLSQTDIRERLPRLLMSLLALLILGIGSGFRTSTASPSARSIDLGSARHFDASHRWHLYYSGDSFHRWPLTDVYSDREFGHRVWSFFYGNDSLEIQNWNVCVRFLARYPDHPRAFNFHGAKAVRIHSAGTRFEVYTGRTTVVIFGPRPLARRAAARLRRVGRPHPPARLRSPVKGSLNGKLRCQRGYQ
jgi:hypothetical protein